MVHVIFLPTAATTVVTSFSFICPNGIDTCGKLLSALLRGSQVSFKLCLISLVLMSPARAKTVPVIAKITETNQIVTCALPIADSWYYQHAFRRAKLEYQDIITLFRIDQRRCLALRLQESDETNRGTRMASEHGFSPRIHRIWST